MKGNITTNSVDPEMIIRNYYIAYATLDHLDEVGKKLKKTKLSNSDTKLILKSEYFFSY